MANGHGGSRPNTGGARPGSGAKKKEHLATIQELIAASVTPDDFEQMVRAMAQKAKEGDVRAFNTLADRYYGKPVERVETTTTNDQKIIIEFEEKTTRAPESERQ